MYLHWDTPHCQRRKWLKASVLNVGTIDMHLSEPSVFGCAAEASPQGKFNADSMLDSKARDLRSALIWTRRQPTDVWIMLSRTRVQTSACRAQVHGLLLGQSDTEQGPVTKRCKKAGGGGEKKGQIVCVLTAFRVIYTEWKKKLCRLHVSTWWELLNYWWMFLITSHKCWNITLLQCLEDEEGGLQCLACLGKHWLALNHGGPCVMALEMWLWERKVSIPSAGARERKWVIKPGGEKRKKKKRSFGGVLEPVILGST